MGNERFTFFWGGPFSQWHQSYFTVDGEVYSHAEQYMMAEKARLFGDAATWELIHMNLDPKRQKALGRQVKNFDEATWKAAARDIVRKGNMAKFGQNPHLHSLLATWQSL